VYRVPVSFIFFCPFLYCLPFGSLHIIEKLSAFEFLSVFSVSFDFSLPYFRYRYLVLAFTMVVMGSCTCLMPYAPSLLDMYVISFVSGIVSGALDTGALVSVPYSTVQ
jgi:hypothetical protein